MPEMTAGGHSGIEASNPALGSIKIFGTDLNSFFTILGFIVGCIIATVLWTHHADVQAGGKEVAKELKDANKEVASVLKESNREIAKVLGELAKQVKIKNCTDAIPATVTTQQRALLVESCRVNQ